MISYIKSELYRILHYKWTYLFIGICSLLLLSANIVLAAIKQADSSFGYATTAFSLGAFQESISVVLILCVTVASMVFGNEYGNHTMKNSISYGVTRGTIYFGKLIVEILFGITAFIIITGIYISSAYLLLENSDLKYLELLMELCFVCLPLFLFTIAAANCFAFMIEGSGAGVTANLGLLIAFPSICSFLGMKFEIFRKLSQILPWNMINNIGYDEKLFHLAFIWEGNVGYYYYWIAGILQMAMITAIGFMVYRKKEIK